MLRFLENIVVIQAARAQTGIGGQPGSQTGIGGQTGLQPSKSLDRILNDVIDWSVGLGLTIAVLFVMYAGYQMLTAGGNEDQFTKGRKTITYAIAGIAVLLLSRGIVDIIRQLIGV
jgi:hypothetical protein